MLREIDGRLKTLNEQIRPYEVLVEERNRLLKARAAVKGEKAPNPDAAKRTSQEDVIAYLLEHPGSKAMQIARGMDVTLGTISAHLFRGNETRFERRQDGWHAITGPALDARTPPYGWAARPAPRQR